METRDILLKFIYQKLPPPAHKTTFSNHIQISEGVRVFVFTALS